MIEARASEEDRHQLSSGIVPATLGSTEALLTWLRSTCAQYRFSPRAVYRRGLRERWPLSASSEAELERELDERGHLMPLPKEPAALANVIEVSVVGFLLDRLEGEAGIEARRGTERGYPDVEISGDRFGGYHALDVKVARRAKSGRQTKSRITLYTGNTYFRYPQLKWPGAFRPFQEYESHLDLIVLYSFVPETLARIENVELLVHEAWRIASRQRSSTTREYLGAVTSIEDLREGNGEFASKGEFYAYWRKFPFKIGRTVQNQLDRLLAGQG
ncbi:MAG TPA: type II restriction endonuclease [Thermoanaerobaculia bacterium]|nr:type II restriction endonuclease [Thermoanaerobaculia bacterium]